MGKQIVDAWYRYLSGAPATDEEKRRAKVCDTCPHKAHGKVTTFLKDEGLKEIEGYYCTLCTCPLSTLIRSTKICDKWI